MAHDQRPDSADGRPAAAGDRDALAEMAARALDAEPALVPYLPELLADVECIGAMPDEVLALLATVDLPRGARALDAGCGRGTVAVALAEQRGLAVHGVDALAAFIESARALAARRGVDRHCRFECDDLRAVVAAGPHPGPPFDLALLLSTGPVLGDLEQTTAALRRVVRRGGYLVIDDAFLRESQDDEPPLPCAYDQYATHDETVRRLTAHGDELLVEQIASQEVVHARNVAATEQIRCRAAELARRHPQAAALFTEYVESQRRETQLLAGPVVGAMWLLRRGA